MRSCYTTQGTWHSTLWWLRGVGWREGKEAQEEIWLMGGVVWWKPTQHCKAIFLQLKIKNKQIHKKTHTQRIYNREKVFLFKKVVLIKWQENFLYLDGSIKYWKDVRKTMRWEKSCITKSIVNIVAQKVLWGINQIMSFLRSKISNGDPSF